MINPIEPLLLIIASANKVSSINLESNFDTLILVHKNSSEPIYRIINVNESDIIQELIARHSVTDIAVISKRDKFDPHILNKSLKNIYDSEEHIDLTLLIPYKFLPVYSHREDGPVQSFIVSAERYSSFLVVKGLKNLKRLAYDVTYHYLNSSLSNNIEIVQVGKPIKNDYTNNNYKEHLERSLLIIPHKGASKLLERCLLHLNQAEQIPGDINLCFDDMSYKKIHLGHYNNLLALLSIYKNTPSNVGPYLSRHYSIEQTDKQYIFLQDSDDISVKSRFCRQMKELCERDLDMIGCHELRIDQIKKKILILRFPADANQSLALYEYHSLFHPTTLITRSAYLRTGGFSTDRRFGYDSQFLLRAHFFLKIGNVDDFLYIRFKRPNSLTTNPATRIGSNLRGFLLWRWNVDFKLITENKLELEESSICVKKHRFDYDLIKL